MLKRNPLLFRFLIVVIFPACAGILFLFLDLKSSITPFSGDLTVEGLNYPVSITHDNYGTPSIVAKTDHDAYFALGFKHASDRLWQLEVQRRLSQGRLSELFGAETLSTDITMRNFGLHLAAEQSLPYLKKTTVDALSAYADGVNAWTAQASSLPVEFRMLGIQPEPWTVTDSLGWQKVFSLTLSGNMMDELRRNQLQNTLTPEQMQYIYPYDPVDNLAVDGKLAEPSTDERRLIAEAMYSSVINSSMINDSGLIDFGIGHLFTGSNAWVVSGKHTESGRPIIANDPHVGLQLPSLWYAAALKGDRLNVSGMTLVGLPMVVFGQNAKIAWGGTSLQSDQQDLFIETTSPTKPKQYLNGDEWKTFTLRKEKINIGAGFPSFLREKLNPVEIIVRSTERGPVVSDIRNETSAVISLRWAALDPEDHTVDAFIDVQYAHNWQEFRASLAQLKSPGLNFLYADRSGNIGLQVAGMMPKRVEGVGILPLTASKQNDWQGYHDFELLPSIYNPEAGFIVNANNKINHSPSIVVSHEWASSARHDRIEALLQASIESKKLISIADIKAIQGDSKDLTAQVLLPVLQKVPPQTPQEADAIAILKSWDGAFDPESVGATLLATWSYYLTHEIFDTALTHSWQRPEESALLLSSLGRLTWDQLAKILITDSHGWCELNQSTTCSKELQRTLAQALAQLEKISSTANVSQWEWREFSSVEFVHQPLGNVKGVEWLFKRSVDVVASPNSINAANILFDPMKGFTQNFGASFRQVFELDDNKSHWYMLSTGQSGNIMSEHFDDMILPFSRVELTQFGVEHQPGAALNLVPSSEL